MKYRDKKFIIILIFSLMIFSLLNMINATLIDIVYANHFTKQFIWYIIGFIILFSSSKINLNKLLNISLYLYIFSIILLILVLFIGNEINGAKAWLNLGFMSFQPSELTKLTLSLYLCKLTMNFIKSKRINEFIYLLKVLIITVIPSILVFIEPDTGAIIFYFLILLTTLIYSKINIKYLLIILFLFIIFISTFTYLYIHNSDILIELIGTSFFYRIDRIVNFSDNYQIINSLTLIGSSSIFGNGLNTINLYIPEAPTDFIIAFCFGNFGLISIIFILLIYFILDLLLIKNIKKANNKLIAFIFLTIFFFQQFYNIFMNIGLLPIMGIPLPFLSYGGSSLIIYFVFLSFYFKEN